MKEKNHPMYRQSRKRKTSRSSSNPGQALHTTKKEANAFSFCVCLAPNDCLHMMYTRYVVFCLCVMAFRFIAITHTKSHYTRPANFTFLLIFFIIITVCALCLCQHQCMCAFFFWGIFMCQLSVPFNAFEWITNFRFGWVCAYVFDVVFFRIRIRFRSYCIFYSVHIQVKKEVVIHIVLYIATKDEHHWNFEQLHRMNAF